MGAFIEHSLFRFIFGENRREELEEGDEELKKGELVRQGGPLVVNPAHTFYVQHFNVKKAYYEIDKSSYSNNCDKRTLMSETISKIESMILTPQAIWH